MAAAIGIAKTATEIFLGVNSVSVDNFTFQLHYRWSVTLFIVSSVLVTTSTFFGDPVQCETVSEKTLLDFAQLCSTLLNFAQLCSTLLNLAQLCSTLYQLCSILLNFVSNYSISG